MEKPKSKFALYKCSPISTIGKLYAQLLKKRYKQAIGFFGHGIVSWQKMYEYSLVQDSEVIIAKKDFLKIRKTLDLLIQYLLTNGMEWGSYNYVQVVNAYKSSEYYEIDKETGVIAFAEKIKELLQ